MTGSPDEISIIVFALLAIFVIWKLRSVLGSRPNDEPRDPVVRSGGEPFPPGASPDSGRIVRFPRMAAPVEAASRESWKKFAQLGTPLWTGLEAIAAADPSFDPESFSQGALKAYEMVVAAFAADDAETLKRLLSEDVYASFQNELDAARGRGETRRTTIVSAELKSLEDARVVQNAAQITVQFSSKLVSTTRDKEGNVIEGDPERVEDHVDDWTFARALRSEDPNWKLIATHPAG